MFGQLITQATKILTKPREYWEERVAAPGDASTLLPQVLTYSALPALAALIGGMLGSFGLLRIVFGRVILVATLTATLTFALGVGVWVIFAHIINALAPSFGAQQNLGQSMKLAQGAMIPVWMGGIMNLIPYMGWLGALAGVGYGAYMFYVGLPMMNGTPQDKAVSYAAAAIGILSFAVLVALGITALPASCCLAGAILA